MRQRSIIIRNNIQNAYHMFQFTNVLLGERLIPSCNIRYDLVGANRDEIEVIKDRVKRLEDHTGLAAIR